MSAASFLKPKNMLFVVLLIITVLGVLPMAGIVDAKSCDWRADGKPREVKGGLGGGAFGLSVKTSDLEMSKAVRERIAEHLRKRGAGELVDNPVTRPRADVALEKGELRWTPFYTSARVQLRVLVTMPRGAAGGSDARPTLEGTCYGLVAQDPWRAELVTRIADLAADAIAADAGGP